MNNRKAFPCISSAAFEHPADHAALEAFKTVPGAASLVKRLYGSTMERSIHLSLLGGAARASSSQFSRYYDCVQEAARILDISPVPEAFVQLGAEPQASTVGVDTPFILVSSAALDLWQDEELLSVVGHEMGHILAGHTIYKTLLSLLISLGSGLSGGIGAAALIPIKTALAEWSRKSELTADRASLLVTQNPAPVYQSLMKAAAGGRVGEMDVNEFFRQAQEYDAAGKGLDSLLKFLDIAGDSHPLASIRMVALQEWERNSYPAILSGSYAVRQPGGSAGQGAEAGAGPHSDLGDAFSAARDSYAHDFSQSQDPLSQAAGKVVDALGGLFKGHGTGQGMDSDSDRDAGGDGENSQRNQNGTKSVEEMLDELFGRKG